MSSHQPHEIHSLADSGIDSFQFEEVYTSYFSALHRYALTLVGDQVMAEEMVHQVFHKLMEKKSGISIRSSLKAYLYRAVHHECLNYLRHEKVKRIFNADTIKWLNEQPDNLSDQLTYKELEQQVMLAVNQLPEQCRSIFQMSRFENLKYAEIAAQLGLSQKTVETQMSRALKKLRVQLAGYLPLTLWILANFIRYKN